MYKKSAHETPPPLSLFLPPSPSLSLPPSAPSPLSSQPKIVRVLNLWQRNEVFPPDVIQPLLALASTDVTHGKTRGSERQEDTSLLGLEQEHQERSQLDIVKSGEDPGNNQNLDLSMATTIIQQQQEQISALLQQQHQLQTQATSLLAPALSSVLVQQQQSSSSGIILCERVGWWAIVTRYFQCVCLYELLHCF